MSARVARPSTRVIATRNPVARAVSLAAGHPSAIAAALRAAASGSTGGGGGGGGGGGPGPGPGVPVSVNVLLTISSSTGASSPVFGSAGIVTHLSVSRSVYSPGGPQTITLRSDLTGRTTNPGTW